ncbi:hypothetical protein ACRZ9O_10205 [Aquirufa sp. HETE-40SA]
MIYRTLSAFNIKVYVYVIFILAPAIFYFLSGKENDELYLSVSDDVYSNAVKLNFFLSLLYFIVFVSGYNFLKIITKDSLIWKSHNFIFLKNKYVSKNSIIVKKKQFFFFWFFVILSGFLVGREFIFGMGFSKLTSLGSEINSAEFRTMGWDEGSKFTDLFIQIIRRNILPYIVVYLLVLKKTNNLNNSILLNLSTFILIVATVQTLDRAPVLMLLLLVFFYNYSFSVNFNSYLFKVIIFALVFPILGGAMTYIQYNKFGFSFEQIFNSGLDFMINRAYFSPTNLTLKLSFSLFPIDSNKLYLEYSRLGFLFGKSYVGTFEDSSIFVAPVTLIGDIWRNFGVLGIVFVGFVNSFYFYLIDFFTVRATLMLRTAIMYLVATLCFYFVFGGYFSLGVFFQMIFILFMVSRRMYFK